MSWRFDLPIQGDLRTPFRRPTQTAMSRDDELLTGLTAALVRTKLGPTKAEGSLLRGHRIGTPSKCNLPKMSVPADP